MGVHRMREVCEYPKSEFLPSKDRNTRRTCLNSFVGVCVCVKKLNLSSALKFCLNECLCESHILELQTLVNCHVGARNRTWVL